MSPPGRKPPTISLEQIAAGVPSVEGKQQKDEKDRQEEQAALESARHRAETAHIAETNRDLRANRRMRYNYAKAVYCYLVGYSTFAGFVVLFSGFEFLDFDLPTVPLTALVGSTAVSAIGLVGIVATGLFRPTPIAKEPKRKKK